MPALLLYLGISKSTWSTYRRDEKLGGGVAYWDDRYLAYLVDRLETGKHISGVIFNLQHNFGWGERRAEEEKEHGVAILPAGRDEEQADA